MPEVRTESRHRVAAMRFRAMAEGATDTKLKAIMLRIAEQHEKIADHLAFIAIARSNVRGPRLSLAAPSEVTSPLVLSLFAYWNQIRDGRLAPSWPEIDPGAIKSCLPFLLVSEVFGEPFDLRYRLAGTEIVAGYGYDPTGITLRGFPHPPANGAWVPLYAKVIEGNRPVFGRYVAEIGRDEIFRVDAVTLPLSQDGRSIDRMIELEDWSVAPGVRRGQIDPAAWRFEMLDLPAS
jgi:PAS domain